MLSEYDVIAGEVADVAYSGDYSASLSLANYMITVAETLSEFLAAVVILKKFFMRSQYDVIAEQVSDVAYTADYSASLSLVDYMIAMAETLLDYIESPEFSEMSEQDGPMQRVRAA